MAIDRTNFNALVDDDGTGTTGSVWNKNAIDASILTPVDNALAFPWSTIAFSAGDFINMAVAAGNVSDYGYCLIGYKTLIFSIVITNASIPSAVNVLYIKLPFGWTVGRRATGTFYFSDGGLWTFGAVLTDTQTANWGMQLNKVDYSNFATGTGTLNLRLTAIVVLA